MVTKLSMDSKTSSHVKILYFITQIANLLTSKHIGYTVDLTLICFEFYDFYDFYDF